MQRQIAALTIEKTMRSGLRGRVKQSSDTGLFVATSLQCASLTVTVHDIVTYENTAGIVQSCVADPDGQLSVIVLALQLLGSVTAHSDRWKLTTTRQMWPANALLGPRSWYLEGDDLILIW